MRDISNSPIFLRLGARLRGPKETTKDGALRRVIISDVDRLQRRSEIRLDHQRHSGFHD
jgi:hypothetical protein